MLANAPTLSAALVRVSPSQIETFEKCKRLWYFGWIEGIRSPSSAAQERGTRIHQVIEFYLLHGRIPSPEETYDGALLNHADHDLGRRLVAKAIENRHLPQGGRPDLEIEAAIQVDILDAAGNVIATMVGRKDLGYEEPDAVYIEDHKSTSSFDYAKTPAQLAENIQLVSYAKAARAAGATKPLVVSHIYYLTKNKIKVATHRVEATLTEDQIAQVWARVVAATTEMVHLRATKPGADAVEPTGVFSKHCGAYGGCQFKERCGITNESQLGGYFTMSDPTKPNSLLDRLRAATGTAAPPPSVAQAMAPVAAPVTERAPDAPPPPPPLATQVAAAPSLLDRLKAQATTAQAPVMLTGDAARALVPDLPVGGGYITTPPGVPAVGVLPPDAAPRVNPPAPPPALAIVPADESPAPAKAKRGRPPKAKPESWTCPGCHKIMALDAEGKFPDHRGVDANLQPDQMAPCVTSGDSPAEAAAWRADLNEAAERQAFLANKAATTPPTTAAQADQELADSANDDLLELAKMEIMTLHERLAAAEGVAKDAIKLRDDTLAARGTAPGFTLYVGVYPVKGAPGAPISFDDWIAPTIAKLTEVMGVPDYGLAKYAEGKGALVGLLGDRIKSEGLPAAMFVPARSRHWEVAEGVIAPFAKTIIRPCY